MTSFIVKQITAHLQVDGFDRINLHFLIYSEINKNSALPGECVPLFFTNIVFPSEAEYSYFSGDFIGHRISVSECIWCLDGV